MKIESGLFDNMVLQRTRRGVSDARFEGACTVDGDVIVRVTQDGRVLRGFARVKAGAAARGRMSGRIQGLPVGGPYDLELRVGEARKTVRNVLVGDVWILGGQSNMEGIGYLKDRARPDPQVRAFYMHDVWRTARDPIHNLGQAVDPVHADLAGGQPPERTAHVGVGPGVAFGLDMLRRSGVPQGLIACAHGGTSMTQWDPAGKRKGGASLYGAMLRRFRKNGASVAGVVWYQGCSDGTPEDAPLYAQRMRRFIAAVRRDCRAPQLPFVLVQISRVMGRDWDADAWTTVREGQRQLPERVKHCAVVPAIDLALDDGIHISGKDQNRLGARLAQAMAAVRGDPGAGKLPIRLADVRSEVDPVSGGCHILVRFDRVVGSLQAAGRPDGFELVDEQGATRGIYAVELQRNTAVLRTGFSPIDLSTQCLYYGYGRSPHCNITDAADRAVPAFGPVHTVKPAAVTPFARRLLVSRALPSAGDLAGLGYPSSRRGLALKARTFAGNFCALNEDLFACAPDDVMVYFVCPFACAEAMSLRVLLGYDGPVKVWIDRTLRFHDPAGTNPAMVDKAEIPLAARPGRHELVVALGSNFGRAWGVSLRFRRKDVTARQIRQGPDTYAMPRTLA